MSLYFFVLRAAFLLAAFLSLNLQAQEFIPLWPRSSMPNSRGLELEHMEENGLL